MRPCSPSCCSNPNHPSQRTSSVKSYLTQVHRNFSLFWPNSPDIAGLGQIHSCFPCMHSLFNKYAAMDWSYGSQGSNTSLPLMYRIWTGHSSSLDLFLHVASLLPLQHTSYMPLPQSFYTCCTLCLICFFTQIIC